MKTRTRRTIPYLLTILILMAGGCGGGETTPAIPEPASPTTPPAVVRLSATPAAVSQTPGTPGASPTASLSPTITPTFTPTLPSVQATIPPLPAPFTGCAGAPVSLLTAGIYAYANQPTAGVLYESANTNAAKMKDIAVGEAVMVLSGPQCAGERAWWQVQTTDGKSGWVPEADPTTRWLVPMPYKPGAALALPAQRAVCPDDPNTPKSRLEKGIYAYVSLTPYSPNLVRASANSQGVVLFQFQPETVMEVLDGPTCADGKVWWQVRSTAGEAGWTAEGDSSNYWLVPVPFEPGLQPGEFSCSAVTEIPVEECEILTQLYNTTGGSMWKNAYGWLKAPAPCAWYGISCSGGSVSGLALADNNLSGSLPEGLGNLQGLTSLKVNSNPLSGALPLNLRRAPALTQFWYDGTDLCEPDDSTFQDWLKALPDRISNGKQCVAGSVPTEDLRPNDGAQLVSETIPDGTVMAPGQFFTKQWVLKNVGKNTWNSTYALVFVGGTRMDAPAELAIPATIRSGTNLTVFIELVAPTTPGTYTASFLLRNAVGETFGVGENHADVFFVQIKVE